MAALKGISFRLYTKTGKRTASFRSAYAYDFRFNSRVIVKPRKFTKNIRSAKSRQQEIETIIFYLLNVLASKKKLTRYQQYVSDVMSSRIDFSKEYYKSEKFLIAKINEERRRKGLKPFASFKVFPQKEYKIHTFSKKYKKSIRYKVIRASTRGNNLYEEIETTTDLARPVKMGQRNNPGVERILYKLIYPHALKLAMMAWASKKKGPELIIRIFYDIYSYKKFEKTGFFSTPRGSVANHEELKDFVKWYCRFAVNNSHYTHLVQYLRKFSAQIMKINGFQLQLIYKTNTKKTKDLMSENLKKMEDLAKKMK